MNWKIRNYNPEVTHVPTGRKVNLSWDQKGCMSTNVRAVFSDHSAEKVENIENDLLRAYKEEKLRWDTAAIIRSRFNDDYNLAIKVIHEQTNKEVSLRTLQSWLIESGRVSSRTCPEWALVALQDYIESHGETLKERITDSIRQQTVKEDIGAKHITALIEKNVTEYATRRIEYEKGRLSYWQNTNYAELPTKIANMEKELRDYALYHNKVITALQGIKYCKNFDEFKSKFINDMQDYDFSEDSIRERIAEIVAEEKEPSS